MTTGVAAAETPVGPTSQKSLLDSGIRLLTARMPHAGSASICAFVGVGSRHEPADIAGASHFLEHLLFKGTPSRPNPEMISGAVEGVGGLINAETEQEFTVYWCKVPVAYVEEVVELLVDLLRNPLLPEDEIERERGVVLDELAMIHDNPDYRVESLLDDMLWPNHALGRDIAGTAESVSSLGREALLNHLTAHYTPSNIVVSVAGAVNHDAIAAQLESLTSGWKPGRASSWTGFPGLTRSPSVRMEYRRTEQAHVSIGLPGASLSDPVRYAHDMLSVVLGEGMSSRLFLEVRERRGLAYDVHSSVTHYRDCGSFQISAGAEPARVYEAVDVILAELSIMRSGVPEADLERARRLAGGRLMMAMEDTRAVSSWYGAQEVLKGDALSPGEAVDKLNSLDVGDLNRAARSLFVAEGLSMAVVGPCRGRRRLEESLKL